MKKVIIAALMLSSCGFTPEGDIARGTIKDKGAQAYDEGLENSLWFLCNGVSIGAIRRKFGSDQRMADAYHTLCTPTVNVIVVK
jgi:hypothetical protein